MEDRLTIADLERIQKEIRECSIPPIWDGEKWVYVFEVKPRLVDAPNSNDNHYGIGYRHGERD